MKKRPQGAVFFVGERQDSNRKIRLPYTNIVSSPRNQRLDHMLDVGFEVFPGWLGLLQLQ